MHRKVAAALVAALALVIASCGGSEESLTRAQLVRRVELACRHGQQESQRHMRASGDENDTATFVEAVLAGQRKQLDEISDLNAPDAVQADFDAYKDGVQARVDAIEKVASADRADVERAMRAVQAEAEAASRRVSAAARRLALEGCG